MSGPLTGAILAGGRASRFGGRAKGLEPVGSGRMIDRVAAALRPAVHEVVIVSNAAEAAEWIPGVRIVRDRYPIRGTMVGVHAALHASTGDIAVAGWDMPFLPPELFVRMAGCIDIGVSAVVPEGPDGPEPAAAIYARSAVSYLERFIEAGDLSMKTLLAALPRVVHLPAAAITDLGDPGHIFTNVNSPDDLLRARPTDLPGG